MSDPFGDDDFAAGNTTAEGTEGSDPAAEFLQREQAELGDLSEELGIADGGMIDSGAADQEAFEVLEQPPPVDAMEKMAIESPPLQVPREEPEKIKKWREEYSKNLVEKDAKEEKMKEELRQQAAKELQDWYKHYEEQLVQTKQDNRQSEKEFVAEINDITPGSEWDRVNKLCDFNSKTMRISKDVSRMRSILLQLKQSPPTKA